MAEIPEFDNFCSSIDTTLSRKEIADLYSAIGWRVRKCSWADYEVTCDWAELVIEAESPILMHGSVADLRNRAEELLAPLKAANVVYSAECYSPDGELEFELRFTRENNSSAT
jgi:hypothetical protein